LFDTNRYGYVINIQGPTNALAGEMLTREDYPLGAINVSLIGRSSITHIAIQAANNYELRAVNVFKGSLGSFNLDSTFNQEWTGQAPAYSVSFSGSTNEIVEIVAEAVICEAGASQIPF